MRHLACLAIGATLVAGTLTCAGANAQSAFGDTSLAYQNGVVYDDDLVPGRGVNQSFLGGDVNQGSSATRFIPSNSQNLIGADGRAVSEVRRAQRRNERFLAERAGR